MGVISTLELKTLSLQDGAPAGLVLGHLGGLGTGVVGLLHDGHDLLYIN